MEGSPSVFKIGDDTVLTSSVIDITEAVEARRKLAKRHALLAEQNRQLWESLAAGAGICLAESRQMRKLMAKINVLAASDVCVVVLGETGTGKTILARVILDISSRRARPFVIVNCAAIPEQLLESEFFGVARGAYTGANENRRGYLAAANGGTFFLDEVGELSLAMQAKLLHAIESKRFVRLGDTREERADIRLICATTRNLDELMQAGKLREDFYYRIFVGDIAFPPLRERKEDIPQLVSFLL